MLNRNMPVTIGFVTEVFRGAGAGAASSSLLRESLGGDSSLDSLLLQLVMIGVEHIVVHGRSGKF